jgi:uncharacterized protein with PQ loop repeat
VMKKSITNIFIIISIILFNVSSTATTSTTSFVEQEYQLIQEEHVVFNCTKWVKNVFNECVTNRMEMAGFWMGLISIAIWVCSQFPQLVENIRRQDASALSGLFLFMFFIADVMNMIGIIFIDAVNTQVCV